MASESGDKGDRSPSLKSGRDNPSTFQANYVQKLRYIMALLITTNELQAQVECNTIVLSDESGGQGIVGSGTAAIGEYPMAAGALPAVVSVKDS